MARDNGMASRDRADTASIAPSFRNVLAAAVDISPLSQEEIGRQVGRTGAAVNQWLKKGDVPDFGTVIRLEHALDLRFGQLARLHSPEVWVIIEMKTSRVHTWDSRSWEQKFREAIIEAPLNQMQRKIVRDAVEQFGAFNSSLSESGPE